MATVTINGQSVTVSTSNKAQVIQPNSTPTTTVTPTSGKIVAATVSPGTRLSGGDGSNVTANQTNTAIDTRVQCILQHETAKYPPTVVLPGTTYIWPDGSRTTVPTGA